MTRVTIFDSTVDDVADITNSYGGFSVAVPIGRSSPLVVFSDLAGPTSLQFDISFGVSTDASNAPSAADDTQWYSLVEADGSAISTETSVTPGRQIVDLSTKLTATAGALVWRGWVPQGVGWIRIRLKRTGNPVTSLKFTLATDSRYISG